MANITQLPSGTWRARVYLGKDTNGKQIFKTFTADEKWKVEKAVSDYEKGGKETISVKTLTVGKAIDEYIELKRNVLAPSTIHYYECIRKNRLQSLMNLNADKLDSFVMQRAINEEAKRLSFKSLKEAKCLVLTALKLYGIKPDINITLPPKKNKVKEIPNAQQVFNLIKGTSIELPCLLAMWLSLRMSEVRGLKFSDVHNGILYVQRANVFFDSVDHVRDVNKTAKSSRSIALPAYIAKMIERIPHKSNDDFIIKDTHSAIYHKFKNLMKANNIEMTFHDLRHLNASIMLMLGVPDKYAMERGGWSTPNVMKSVYQHTFSDERKEVDKRIDQFFNNLIVDTALDTK